MKKKEEMKKNILWLLEHGEDKNELMFWYELFDTLTTQEQDSVIENLKMEIRKINEVSQ